jgi:hypothetical protein
VHGLATEAAVKNVFRALEKYVLDRVFDAVARSVALVALFVVRVQRKRVFVQLVYLGRHYGHGVFGHDRCTTQRTAREACETQHCRLEFAAKVVFRERAAEHGDHTPRAEHVEHLRVVAPHYDCVLSGLKAQSARGQCRRFIFGEYNGYDRLWWLENVRRWLLENNTRKSYRSAQNCAEGDIEWLAHDICVCTTHKNFGFCIINTMRHMFIVSLVALAAVLFMSRRPKVGEKYYTSPLEIGGPPVFVPDAWPDDTRFGRRVPPTF